MENSTIGILLAILAAAFWGIGNTIARVGLQSVKTASATILSLLTGLIVALIIALIFEFEALVSLTLLAIGMFALTGIFHFALGRFLLYQSMKHIGAARGTSITHSFPLFALIFSTILLKETPTIPVVIGTLLIVGGIYLLLSERSGAELPRRDRILGYTIGLATALCWGITAILIKNSSQFGPPFVILSVALFSGILVLSLFTLRSFDINIKTNRKAINLLLIAGLLNGIGLASFYSALATTPVVIVTPLAATSPLFTVLCVHLFLRRLERVTIHVLIGCSIIVIGGILVAVY